MGFTGTSSRHKWHLISYATRKRKNKKKKWEKGGRKGQIPEEKHNDKNMIRVGMKIFEL